VLSASVPSFDLEEVRGVVLLRCRALGEIPGIAHAFSTVRAEGATPFDLGTAGTADPAILERRERFLETGGFAGRVAAIVRQVHGTNFVRAADAHGIPEADGVTWSLGEPVGLVPAVRTADCVPILLADRWGTAVLAVHAGWRGTAARIAVAAVGWLSAAGIRPESLVVALGPAILACCYEVGNEVAEALAGSVPGARSEEVARPDSRGRTMADLHAANRLQLLAEGVLEASIHLAPWCTRCHPEIFYSYRGQGAAAGRMMACIGPVSTDSAAGQT